MVNELKHVIGNAKELPYHKYLKWKNLRPHGVVVYLEVNLQYMFIHYIKREFGTLKNQWLFRGEVSSWFIIDNLRKWINYVSSFYYHFSNQSPCFRQLIVLILYSNHLPFPCKNWIGEGWKNWNVVMFLRWHVLTE